MALTIEDIISMNSGTDKIAAEASNGLYAIFGYGQELVKMGEDFSMFGNENGVDDLRQLGADLVYLGERMGAGISKMAAETYDANLDYADMACDLLKVACFINELHEETGNAVVGGYAKTAAEICDAITDDLGGDYVAQVWREKNAGFGETMKNLYTRTKGAFKNVKDAGKSIKDNLAAAKDLGVNLGAEKAIVGGGALAALGAAAGGGALAHKALAQRTKQAGDTQAAPYALKGLKRGAAIGAIVSPLLSATPLLSRSVRNQLYQALKNSAVSKARLGAVAAGIGAISSGIGAVQGGILGTGIGAGIGAFKRRVD